MRYNLPQSGKDFPRRNGLGLTSFELRDAADDLCLPRSFGTGLWLKVHAVQKSSGQCQTLIWGQNKYIVGDGF